LREAKLAKGLFENLNVEIQRLRQQAGKLPAYDKQKTLRRNNRNETIAKRHEKYFLIIFGKGFNFASWLNHFNSLQYR